MIDIHPEHLKAVKKILKEHIPGIEVRAFGSRVTRTAKYYSDLDLALVNKEKISLKKLNLLKLAFEESDIPFRVDLVDWNMIDDTFKEIIRKKYEVIY